MTLTDIANACGTDKGDWQGFTRLYERYLPGPDAKISMAELGVYRGDSLRLWANYFRHDQSLIIGVDINLSLVDGRVIDTDDRIRLVRADQADEGIAYGAGVLTGGLDVLVDDASHEGDKTQASFKVWWPQVKHGGLYVIEDTHCSYNTDHYRTASQTLDTPGTLMNFVKRLADDVNWGIHGYNRFAPMYKDIAFVHFYPGIAFIGKKRLQDL